MKKYLLLGLVVLLFVGVAFYFLQGKKVTSQFSDQKSTSEIKERVNTTGIGSVKYKVESFAEGLFVPWSIVFTSSDRVLVTERNGKIRVIENGQLKAQPLITFSEVSAKGEEGLMGLEKGPDYETNKILYASYAYLKGKELVVKIVSLKDEGNQLSVERVILDSIPAANFHAGTRIKFGPDGKLYVTTGDASKKELAQKMDSLAGKILRLNSDGTIPSDNPFPNSYVYSLGHRNPQGIAWHPITNELYSTEHGPSLFDGPAGGDEVNRIQAGKNYGWPTVSHEKHQDGLEDPLAIYTPAIAPAGAMFYTGDVFPQFKNHLMFAMLKGEGIFDFDSKGKLSEVNVGRIRDIVEGPDGFIYFSTSNRDGRGDVVQGDDHIFRLVPSE
jgi:glucose/arabinose dehydrogenase